MESKTSKTKMVIEQLKRQVNREAKDHFTDQWADIKEAVTSAHKVSAYETAWGIAKRPNEEKFSRLRKYEADRHWFAKLK